MKDVSIKDVFISYRRDGGQIMAHHLRQWLTNDGYTVFLDVQLESGRFDKALYKRIEECTDFLLVVSPGGFDRCNDPEDWVRWEIEHALLCGKNIIPVIMPGCKIPDVLPESIQGIKKHRGFQFDFELEKSAFEMLEEKLMQSKPRVSVAQMDLLSIERPAQQSDKEGVSLHEQMTQQALRDTMDNAENHITAINASLGNADDQFRLWKYYHSVYVENYIQPPEKMMYWLRLAVEQNHPEAICCMGKCYYHGYGVERSPAKAVIFYRKSLEYDENLTEAMCSLGDCYLNGVGVESSVVQAADLYKRAMEVGDSEATEKYINLLRTADAVRKLNWASAVKKIKSVIEKKEMNIDLEKVFRLMVIRQLGFIRYDSLRRFRLLDDHGHNLDQIGEECQQKYQRFMNNSKDPALQIMTVMVMLIFWLMPVIFIYEMSSDLISSITSTFAEMGELFAKIEIPDSVRELWVPAISEIRKLFAGIDIPDSMMTVLVSIGQWMVTFLDSVLLPLCGGGIAVGLQMFARELYKDPEPGYWNLRKKVCKFLARYAVFVLIYLFVGFDIAFLALTLYLILPHKLLIE